MLQFGGLVEDHLQPHGEGLEEAKLVVDFRVDKQFVTLLIFALDVYVVR